MSAKLTMGGLGRQGQWGNQVIQYAFIRAAAKRFGLDYELPAWAGQYLFGHVDPPITKTLPQFCETYQPTKHERIFGLPIPPGVSDLRDRNFSGYAQYHTSWYAPDKEFLLGLYDVVSPERERVEPALDRLRGMGKTLIVLHLRRSDAGRMIFFLTPITWYLRWLREHWRRFENPILYIATEEPALVRYFVHYQPVMMEGLGLVARQQPPNYVYPYGDRYHDLRQLDFFPDWYIMQHADIVAGSDSTFSFSAAWMNRHVREYWRARLRTQRFEQIDPWNAEVSWREHLNDYPGIPGTQTDSNPIYGDHWRNYSAKHPSVPLDPEEIASLMTPE